MQCAAAKASKRQAATHTKSASPTTKPQQRKATRKTVKRTLTTTARVQTPTLQHATQQKTPTTTQTKTFTTSSQQRRPTTRAPSHPLAFTTTTALTTTPFLQNGLMSQSKRSLFIQTHSTPNPRSLKFTPGKIVLGDREDGAPNTAFFDQSSRANARRQCPLAYTLLLLDGVMNVMLGSDFVTVTTIDDNQDWMLLKPMIYEAISEAYATDEPILKEATEIEPSKELPTLPGDEDAVSLIKEIIDLRIRPTVMDDGGDVEFIHFDKERVVWLLMKGSCSGCPSSGATLKHGIQNMIMHYVPEVKSVDEWKDQAELVSDEVFKKLEAKLAAEQEARPQEKH